MNTPKVSPAIRAGIVARVMAGKSTAAAEARRHQVRPALVRGWVYEKRKEMKKLNAETTSDPTKQDPTKTDAGVSTEGATGGNPTQSDPAAAERARAAAGISSGGGPAKSPTIAVDAATLAAISAAEEEDKRFVVESYRDAKEGVLDPIISQLGMTKSDPAAVKMLHVPVLTEQALKANASWIAPKTREKMVGWLPLLIGLGIDGIVTFFTVRSVIADVVKARMAEDKKAKGAAPAAPAP